MCLGCARYEVTATFTGRLDTVDDPSLKRDSAGKIIGFGGFGNMNAYPARLVLQSVADVTPKEIDFSKNDDGTKGEPDAASAEQRPLGAIASAQKLAAALGRQPAKDQAVEGFRSLW